MLQRYREALSKQRIVFTLHHMIKRYYDDNVGKSAAALAYYLIFSFFPFLVLLNTVIGFLDLPPLTVNGFQSIIPIDVINIINAYLEHISQTKNTSLLFFGLFFTVYFTMRAMNSLLRAVCQACRIREEGSFFLYQIKVFLATLFLMLTIVAAMLLMTVGRSALTFLARFIPLDTGSIALWNLLRFVILAAMLFFVLSLLYYLGPGRAFSFRETLPGAFFSLMGWLAFSIAFAYYVENMGNYSIVYGSIGAVIVLLLWLYFSAVTLIMGAELNSILRDRPLIVKENRRRAEPPPQLQAGKGKGNRKKQ